MSRIALDKIQKITTFPEVKEVEKPKPKPEIITIKEFLLNPCKPIEPARPECDVKVVPVTNWDDLDIDWDELMKSYTPEEMEKLLKEIAVRFDTSPRQLEKIDFKTLIKALFGVYTSTTRLDWEAI